MVDDTPHAEHMRLVAAALAGDAAALRTLCMTLSPFVHARVTACLYRHARHARGLRLDIRQEATDLCQQVFVALFENDARALRSWDVARGRSLPSFVALVAERETIATLRTRKKRPFAEEPLGDDLTAEVGPDLGAGAEEVVASRQMLDAILNVIQERLGERGVELFHRLVVLEHSASEVAAEIGMTEGAVYAWQGRLRKIVQTIARYLATDSNAPSRKDERVVS